MTWWGGAVRTTPRRADPTVASHIATPPKHVMAGLVPAIHVLFCQVVFAWMPGTGPGHDVMGRGCQEDAATGRPDRGLAHRHAPQHVMAGLVPAIHVFLGNGVFAWMPGTGPGHDAVGWGYQEDAATGRPGRGPRTIATPHKHVMAGLVPAMHVFLGNGVFAWMPGTGPGHDVVGWGCQEDAATGRPDRGLAHRYAPQHVMPGLVPAIHVLFCQVVFAWMPGTGPGHDGVGWQLQGGLRRAAPTWMPGTGPGHDVVGWGCQEDAATGRPDRGRAPRHAPSTSWPAIHVFLGNGVFAWMPGTGPGHDVMVGLGEMFTGARSVVPPSRHSVREATHRHPKHVMAGLVPAIHVLFCQVVFARMPGSTLGSSPRANGPPGMTSWENASPVQIPKLAPGTTKFLSPVTEPR